jgi:hypothetical protein
MKHKIFIEKMDGFDGIISQLEIPNIEIEYAEFSEILDKISFTRNILGIIKSPRGKITQADFETIASLHKPISVSYIGRHAEKIINSDVTYSPDPHNHTELLIKTQYSDIRLQSVNQSPISRAVTAFIINTSTQILTRSTKRLEAITISKGNTFVKRIGHSYADISNSISLFKGKSIGIIGAGEVGEQVINKFNQLGATIQYSDVYKKDFNNSNITFTNTDMILQSGFDIVSIHLPSTVFVSLKSVKNIDLLINTASGKNIAEQELIDALLEGRIQRALIDVFEKEELKFSGNISESQSLLNPLPSLYDTKEDKNRKQILNNLIDKKKLFLTPHIAYNEDRALRETLILAITNISGNEKDYE